jgi:outer membrane biosynthesis protein TonB
MTMAFETFLTVDKQKPRKSRRLTFVISLAAHVVLLGVGVASSFAGVDELAPKSGTLVTFTTLPVPPPPPAGKKQNKTKPKTVTKVVRPITNKIVAPTEQTKEEKDTEGPDGVDPNGDPDGDPNTIGPGGGHTETIPMLPPSVGKGFLAIDPQLPQHRPHMPPGYAGRTVSALMRVCTDRDGNVIEVKVLRGFDPTVDAAFVSALRTWRYSPFKIDGRPVPFCTNVAYSVQSTN